MTRNHFLAGLVLGLSMATASPIFAETAPASMGADARVRAVLYNPVDVIRLDTTLRVNTAIELGADRFRAPGRQ
jgi:type IV secretion system protein VirB9